jgi:hypothetical protein
MKKLILAAFALTTAVSVFAQGQVVFNNRILNAGGISQTAHVWGPDSANPTLSLIGLGSNDSPTGATAFGAASNMQLIGAGGSGGKYGYATTFSQLLYGLGTSVPEASLVPTTGVATFRSGTSLGDVASIASTLGTTTASADAPFAVMEMVAWDNSSGLYSTWTQASAAWNSGLIAAGRSSEFTVASISGTANGTPLFTSNGATISGLSFNLYFIPEPTTFALAGMGLAALLVFRRRNS